MTNHLSSEAYHVVREEIAPRLRDRIVNALFAAPHGLTTSALADSLGVPRDHISPRMAELVARDVVEPDGTTKDPVTGMTVTTWQLTGRPALAIGRTPTRKDRAARFLRAYIEQTVDMRTKVALIEVENELVSIGVISAVGS